MHNLFKNWNKQIRTSVKVGQGFTEYALILLFVSIAVMLAITILEPSVRDVFARLVGREEISPPSLANYQAPPTPTFDPNYTPQPTNTPDPYVTPSPTPIGGGGTATSTPTPLPTSTNTPEPLPEVCNSYDSGDTPISLPNGTNNISSAVTADNGNGPIYDVNVTIDMSHTYVGDLVFTVISPGGETVRVIDQPGLPESSYGCSRNDISATLDDDAALPVEDECDGTPAIDGTFSPNNSLSAFDGLSSQGTWTLLIDDEYPSEDAGTLNSWSLELCTGGGTPPTPTPEPLPTSTPVPVADNLCLTATTTQSSTANGGASSRACDGNRDGNFNNGSVATTNSASNSWWQVDLGRVYVLQQIKLFSRTDCCMSDLSNFYVLISDEPFQSTDLTATINHPLVDSFYFEGNVDALAYAFSKQSGRHIRIQRADSGPLSLAEVEIYGSLWVPNDCVGVADIFYIFDLSGSMAWDFDGTTTKIEAAKNAAINLNNAVAADNPDHRVGFTTYTGFPWYYTSGWNAEIKTESLSLTNDIAAANAQVNSWSASGGTPTGGALNAARLTIIEDWDPLRIPVIILVSDGVPTINQNEHYTNDSLVTAIDVYDGNGDPYEPSEVANSGGFNDHGERAGLVVADTMNEAQEVMRALPNATMHSIAIGGGDFNAEVLQYVADTGGGQYFSASNSSELSNQLISIFNGISCSSDS